ncbi:cell wall-active antibiotics response protein LiaF [Streptococcus hillyeri]|uniref:Transporter n=1 Tax=Streptococcus hillyeri TaxID=2282420 RepID=A0A3L9DTF7_9STRE|nr:cell wall-active antibiotics response protein LiaF [Streptococcus hillyeri]RLY02939.1 transporter [Streptococcus hillyeri]
MKKFHIFLIVESILLAMAIMTILSKDISAFLLLLVVTLLLLRFYNLGSRNNFLLIASFWLLFLVFMLNPYVIVAILFGMVYMLINHFSQVKQKNRRALIQFEEELSVTSTTNQWIGEHEPLKRTGFAFDDINIIRLTGNDTIDLTEVIVAGKDNHILIRKIYGPTQVIVPIDVAVRLNASSVYGSITFLDYPEYDLRNETITLEEECYRQSHKRVKLVVSVLAGNVEVVRR